MLLRALTLHQGLNAFVFFKGRWACKWEFAQRRWQWQLLHLTFPFTCCLWRPWLCAPPFALLKVLLDKPRGIGKELSMAVARESCVIPNEILGSPSPSLTPLPQAQAVPSSLFFCPVFLCPAQSQVNLSWSSEKCWSLMSNGKQQSVCDLRWLPLSRQHPGTLSNMEENKTFLSLFRFL